MYDGMQDDPTNFYGLDVGIEPYNIDGMLSQLHLAGIFNQVSGVIFGKFEKCKAKKAHQGQGTVDEVIDEWSSRLRIPCIKNFTYGHGRRGAIIGTLQLTFIPYLTYKSGKRALIEGVRIDESYRGNGIGKQLIEWAIEKSRQQDCHMVQLTTDKKHPDALEFYKRLCFIALHEDLKLFF